MWICDNFQIIVTIVTIAINCDDCDNSKWVLHLWQHIVATIPRNGDNWNNFRIIVTFLTIPNNWDNWYYVTMVALDTLSLHRVPELAVDCFPVIGNCFPKHVILFLPDFLQLLCFSKATHCTVIRKTTLHCIALHSMMSWLQTV